jgi:hypothetical protein
LDDKYEYADSQKDQAGIQQYSTQSDDNIAPFEF